MEKTKSCPCGSQQNYSNCCAPYHDGRNPETAEQLLRARYAAFVLGKIDFIMATHHSDTLKDVKKDEIEEWAKNSEWKGLEIEASDKGKATDEEGVIVFHARYHSEGKDQDHHEKSFFKKENGVWKFHDAHGIQTGPFVREEPKTGRNDPCPCGSGKKYKKCHAA